MTTRQKQARRKPDEVTYTCAGCGAQVTHRGKPPGWKTILGRDFCNPCFCDRYEMRATTLPVAEAVGSSWDKFLPALHDSWRKCFRLANWLVGRLYALDDPLADKAPEAITKCNLYGLTADHYPDFDQWAGAKQSLATIVRAVKTKYLRERFEVMKLGRHSLLTYRYPYPLPISSQSYTLDYEPGDFPAININLPMSGPWRLRLKRKADLARQLARFRQAQTGAALPGEAALYRSRNGDIMLKIAGWFPRRPNIVGDRVAFIHRDPNAFLVVEISGRAPWILNCDHLKRAHMAHKVFLKRLSEDTKREKRLSRNQKRNIQAYREERCRKHANVMDTALHTLSAQVVQFCERQRVSCAVYDNTDRNYLPTGFPWSSFDTNLTYKLESARILLLTKGKNCPDIPIPEDTPWNLEIAERLAQAGRKLLAHKKRKGSHPAVSVPPATSSTSGSTPSARSSKTRSTAPRPD